jgi:hypothetical protein
LIFPFLRAFYDCLKRYFHNIEFHKEQFLLGFKEESLTLNLLILIAKNYIYKCKLKERGGSSRQAILKYIMANFNVGKDAKTVNVHLKLSLRAGVKNKSFFTLERKAAVQSIVPLHSYL